MPSEKPSWKVEMQRTERTGVAGSKAEARSQSSVSYLPLLLACSLPSSPPTPLSPRMPSLPQPDILCTEHLPTSLDPFLRVVFDPFSPIVDTQQVKSCVLVAIHYTCVSGPCLPFTLLEEGGCLTHLCFHPVQREHA